MNEVTCQEFVELVTDYLDGALTGPTLGRVEEHLVICELCVTYLHQMDETIGMLGELEAASQALEPSAAVLSALRARAAEP